MRMLVGVIGGLIVVGWAAAPSASAPPAATNAVPGANSVSTLSPKSPGGPRLDPGLRAVASALSASECTNLGGKVYDDPYGVCASKKLCNTTDNKGANHAVCLSATAGNVW